MAGSIMGINNYYSLFVSPFKTYEVSPVANLLYGTLAGRTYSRTVAKNTQATMSFYLSSLNSTANTLKNSAKPFTARASEASFSKKALTASDGSAVSGTAASDADMKDYTLNISFLAKAQVNNGTALSSWGKSFSPGLNTLSLRVGDNLSRNISFTIGEHDTNKSSLSILAGAINKAKAGVTASVFSDSRTGTSYLSIASDRTGTDSGFSISDISGNASAISGIGNISVQAQNAQYTLDGKAYTSQTNSIRLNSGKVELRFNKAEGKDIKVSVGSDLKAIKDDIENFVDSYNSTVSFVSSMASSFEGAAKLQKELNVLVQSKSYSLENSGMRMGPDGKISLDGTKLESSLKNNIAAVRETFSGYNGIAEKIYSKATEVLSNPVKYLMSTAGGMDYAGFYGYLSPGNRMAFQHPQYLGYVIDTFL